MSSSIPGTVAGRVSVAPMMGCTDRHFRLLVRLISPSIPVYSEMIPSGALLHGQRAHFLARHPGERLTALQLGGREPRELADCAGFAAAAGYDEVNLNVGCPSSRVKHGNFGASLMLQPGLVADCVRAMQAAVRVPVTVKCRIGVDERDSYAEFRDFVDAVADGGCRVFIVHARKALSQLSPKHNREIPPLRYEFVERLKAERPQLGLILNGGITELAEILALGERFDGVMLGRKAYQDPFFLAEVERAVFGTGELNSRDRVAAAYLEYMAAELAQGTPLKHPARHLFGLYLGCPGARAFRRALSDAIQAEKPELRRVELALAEVRGKSAPEMRREAG